MPSSKDRLYVGLFLRSGSPKLPGLEDTRVKYHWGLLVGPKTEAKGAKDMQYHAKERITPLGQSEWVFEQAQVQMHAPLALLVRITVAKIEDRDRLADVLRQVPIRKGESGWNCVGWVKEALERLKADDKALGTNAIEWEKVRDAAMSYCQRKKDGHRFDGHGNFDTTRVATYDLMIGEEVIP